MLPTNGSYQNQPHLTSCFDIFVRINSLSSANFKYVKSQFYDRLCPNVGASTSVDETSKSSLRNPKHRYEKVSTPISCGHIPKFQQKGSYFYVSRITGFRNRLIYRVNSCVASTEKVSKLENFGFSVLVYSSHDVLSLPYEYIAQCQSNCYLQTTMEL